MAEIRRGFGGDAGGANERLPWLEPVEDEDDDPEGGGGFGGFAILGIGILIALAVIITGVVLVRRWHAGHADIGQVIRAPATPYKTKPADPGGLVTTNGTGVVSERTGTGNDIDAPLDLAAMPEQPVAGPGSNRATAMPEAKAPASTPVATAPVPPKPAAPAATPTQPAPVIATKAVAPAPSERPAPVPEPLHTTGGGTIQLGALGSEAKARAVWKTLSGRFAYLAPLAMSITPVKVGDSTLYRLRASGADAHSLCARLKIAGETCAVVN